MLDNEVLINNLRRDKMFALSYFQTKRNPVEFSVVSLDKTFDIFLLIAFFKI